MEKGLAHLQEVVKAYNTNVYGSITEFSTPYPAAYLGWRTHVFNQLCEEASNGKESWALRFYDISDPSCFLSDLMNSKKYDPFGFCAWFLENWRNLSRSQRPFLAQAADKFIYELVDYWRYHVDVPVTYEGGGTMRFNWST